MRRIVFLDCPAFSRRYALTEIPSTSTFVAKAVWTFAQQKTNIVIIWGDDIGLTDVSAQGSVREE